MQDCVTCDYAERDSHGRFTRMCYGYGNCHYDEYKGIVEPTVVEKMETLKVNMNVELSKNRLNTPEAAYKYAILKCIEIVESE